MTQNQLNDLNDKIILPAIQKYLAGLMLITELMEVLDRLPKNELLYAGLIDQMTGLRYPT